MTKKRRIFRASRPGLRLRWFATEAGREAWIDGIKRGDSNFKSTRIREERRPVLVDVKTHLRSRANRPGANPVTGVYIDPDWRNLKGQTIVPEGVIRTVCPGSTHDPRVQVGPDDVVPALFSALKPGQYLEPASTWAAAAVGGA